MFECETYPNERAVVEAIALRAGSMWTVVSSENLLMRRLPQISPGEDPSYGMGLMVDRKYGVPVVFHGDSMAGYKTNLYFLPESGIGADLLTNSDNGGMLLGPFSRRLLEVVFKRQTGSGG